jgi:hypothetical protein
MSVTKFCTRGGSIITVAYRKAAHLDPATSISYNVYVATHLSFYSVVQLILGMSIFHL